MMTSAFAPLLVTQIRRRRNDPFAQRPTAKRPASQRR
jgi:hypothetical protein